MAKKKAKIAEPVTRELVVLTDEIEILNLCKSITRLNLDPTCHMDRAYAKKWYESHYMTGVHVRYAMKPGLSINHVADGIVYRAFNCTDAIAERLMKENADYIPYFDDLGPIGVEDEPTPIPEPEAPVEPEEKTDEELINELG
nr:MAG TPA: hypothetical protein [Caudoviricetes sp.]